jgi:glycosyltransferase involved in cell wall biosynthesis
VNGKFLPTLAGVLEAYYYRLRKIWQHVDIYICPSQFMADKLVQYGFPKSRMRVVPNPFVAQPVSYPLGDKVVYLGRTHYEKGIKIFMEAAKELRDYKLVVAGSGPEDAWVQEFVRKNILTNVERLGWVGGDAWKQVMLSAKVIVVPAVFYENCSLAILEAMSYGRIIVAVDRGGNPELVKDGITGFLAKPENPTDLAATIRRAMQTSEADSAKIVAGATELLKKNHNPDDYFKRIEDIYAEVLKMYSK